MLRTVPLLVTAVVLALGLTLTPVVGDQPESGGPVASAAVNGDAYIVRLASHNIKCEMCGGAWAWRARRSAQMVRNNRVNAVTFQEVGATQLQILRDQLPRYRFWPKRKFGPQNSQNQIAWKRGRYRTAAKGTVRVPVRGRLRVVPWVKLRVRNGKQGAGRAFFVIGFHNSPRNREWERDRATEIQIDLIRRKVERRTGKPRPVFIMGDANERVEWCNKVHRRTPLRAVNGTRRNPCPVPPGGPDWMMGNDRGTAYKKYRRLRGYESMHQFVIVRARVRRSSVDYWSNF